MALLFHVFFKLFLFLLRLYLHFSNFLFSFFSLFSLLLLLFLQFFDEILSFLGPFTLETEIIDIQAAWNYRTVGTGCSDCEAASLIERRRKLGLFQLGFDKLIFELLYFLGQLNFLNVDKFCGTTIMLSSLLTFRHNGVFLYIILRYLIEDFILSCDNIAFEIPNQVLHK